MLLESITLENFRQFRHESIDFAQGENGKNVTIIIGDNGTGKTTFAQAFFWCMYGETEVSDKDMLNKLVAADLKPGQEAKVQVKLCLRHGNVRYTLMREQTYRKDYSNRVRGIIPFLNLQETVPIVIPTSSKSPRVRGRYKGKFRKEYPDIFS